MVVAYIKEEKKTSMFQGVEIENFENNFIITLYDKERKRIKNKLIKYIQKLHIDTLVFSEGMSEYKEEVLDKLEESIVILNGRKVMEYLQFDIMQYILEKQNKNIKQEEIYIVFKKRQQFRFEFLENIYRKF